VLVSVSVIVLSRNHFTKFD